MGRSLSVLSGVGVLTTRRDHSWASSESRALGIEKQAGRHGHPRTGQGPGLSNARLTSIARVEERPDSALVWLTPFRDHQIGRTRQNRLRSGAVPHDLDLVQIAIPHK